ncbi:alpha-amylase family glycosyl hydrolase [Halobacteria archaeon AArc-m2/3/4]|uniref:Alpha-amylase family glycosyl hydrolase n=1 Tax=Natronoglomus mannanivorans TaxID=2979990 RepID=A0ABT2Q9S4_9EURY|nr:alpha-amylase family glycosyl hydrolase [Halobacteria archaeon AArc-m2/3/4]
MHPGPPRFCTVSEAVELAPRHPEPDASYAWSTLERPDGSDLSVGSNAVVHVEPDVPGTYRFELEAPDGRYEQTVRAFPDPRRSVRFELPVAALPDHDPADVSVIGPFNDHLVGRDRPRLEDDTYVYETRLPPGSRRFAYVVGENVGDAVWDNVVVPGPGRPRLALAGEVREGELVVTADAEPGTDSGYDASDLDIEYVVDDRDRSDLPPDALSVTDGVARIDRDTIEGTVRLHAVAVGERHSVADCLDIRVAADGTPEIRRPNEPPEWARDTVVYEIFVRSFTHEASFDALERRVPYLAHLGVDCVWLTPILAGPTTHGYHTTDYFETASDLGTREDFQSFVDRCHDAGIRVVFDLVINHTAREHPAFDMSAAGVPEYRDWYVWESLESAGLEESDLESELEDTDRRASNAPPSRKLRGREREVAQYYFDWRGIPNLNYDSLAVRAFVLSVVDEWADVVDGYRCDVAWAVPHGFWKEVRDRVRERDPEFLLLDESIPRDPDFQEGEFDVHYDTTLYDTLRDIGTGDRPAAALLEAATAPEREGFPDRSLHMRYVENHDEPRYLEECSTDALHAAAAATCTLPGVPLIYYGQERGATEYRGPIPWEGDGELTSFHRELIETRADSAALSGGEFDTLEYDADSDAAVAFARTDSSGSESEGVIVALNFGSEPATVRVRLSEAVGGGLEVGGENEDEATDLVSGTRVPIDRDGDAKTVSFPVADVVVLETTV